MNNLQINKIDFKTSFYEMDLEFDNTKVLNFLKKHPFRNSEAMTTYFDNQNILENAEELSELKEFIDLHLHIFNANILQRDKFFIKESWFQAYGINSYHPLHIHGTEYQNYSLIFYIQTTEDSSKTIFYCPGFPYVPEQKHHITPKQGRLVIFPSYIPHCVKTNNDEQRIILSANVNFD